MSDSSALKTLLMGGAAVTAIIIAIVVGVKTFSDPSESTEEAVAISGSWARKAGFEIPGPPKGAPREFLVARDIIELDASTLDSGSVTLSTADGRLDGKVLGSQPGTVLLEVATKHGKTVKLTLNQISADEAMVSDGLTAVPFERKP